MNNKASKTIILGAGLAGLSAAYHSGFPVYEAQKKAGGISDSVSKEGFVFDYGIHILQSRIEYFKDLMDKLKVPFNWHQRSSLIYSFGSYTFYPFQINTSHLPFIHRIRCIAGYFLRNKRSNPENYSEWIIKSFGKGFAEIFLIPYSEKFWRISTNDMTFEWTDVRIPIPKFIDVIKGAFKDHIVKIGTNQTFQYPSESGAGFGAIPSGFLSKIDQIHLGMKATSIDLKKKTITFNNHQKTLEFDNLISTIPLPELIKIIKNVPYKIQSFADQLNFNSIAIVNLGINRTGINQNHWIHFPEKDISFFRISFPNNFGRGINPENTSMIQAEVSYDRNNPPEMDELLKKVHNDLIKTGVLLAGDKIIFSDIMYIKYAYVIYDKLRKESVKNIHNFLNENSIYPCGRFGKWEYLWSDESAMSGKDTVERIIKIEKEVLINGS